MECGEAGLIAEMAREVVRGLLTKILGKLQTTLPQLPRSAPSGSDVGLGDLKVRWMASGNTVCAVPTTPKMCVSEVKFSVQEQAGVPVKEQRLFFGSLELCSDASAPSADDGESLLLVRSVSDPRVTDLGHFRPTAAFARVPQGAFTQVRKLATGINGDIFLYRRHQGAEDSRVAVKKLRNDRLERIKGTETDERTSHLEPWKNAPDLEDALTEIGVLSYLAKQPDLPMYLLRAIDTLADHQFTWLVTEFADGGELFDVVASGCVDEDQARRYMWQLLQAVAYLHKHHIGHRDISLENVLLKNDVVRLMDFGMAVQSHSASGTPLQYFRAVGKDFYRAPECYVPQSTEVAVVAPSTATSNEVAMVRTGSGYLCQVRFPADVAPRKTCKAEVWGYTVNPVDIFASGAILFMLCTKCPPWHCARMSDPSFSYVYDRGDKGLGALLEAWGKPPKSSEAMSLLTEMLRPDPASRPSVSDCLSRPWFASMADHSVPVHGPVPDVAAGLASPGGA